MVDKVVATWYDGKTQTLTNVAPNRMVQLTYAEANEKAPVIAKPAYLFTNVTDKLKIDFKHEEDLSMTLNGNCYCLKRTATSARGWQ